MLNVQRYRGADYREEIEYTRKWVWAHMILGAAVTALFLFHETFDWFAGSAAWYALSLVVTYGFMIEHQICRVLLALLLLGGAAAGVFFINRVFPVSVPPRMTLIPQPLMPIIVGLACMAFTVNAMFLLFSSRIRKAGRVGFSLW